MPRLLAALVAFSLAGCVAPSLSSRPEPSAAAGFEVAVGNTGCTEVGLGRHVTMDHARALLPPGFEPGDASGFLGYPAPLGFAFVASGLLRCETSSLDPGPSEWADLIVYVERPDLAGADSAGDRHEFYQLAHFTSGPRHRELLLAGGMPLFQAEVAHDTQALGTVGVLEDEDGAVAEARIVVAPAGDVTYAMRFWHVSEAGVLSFTFDRTPTAFHLGTPVTCALRADSAHAQAFGGTDCGGTDAVVALFPEPSDITGTLRFRPAAPVASG